MSESDPTTLVAPPLSGRVRVDEKTRSLAARLEPGEIAVIDHPDLDQSTADVLVAARPSAVLNAAQTLTGRHPSLGAKALVDAGIVLIDDLGADVMTLSEGDDVEIDGPKIIKAGVTIATGTRHENFEALSDSAPGQDRVRTLVAAFAASADEYIAQDGATVLRGQSVPQITIRLRKRPVLLVCGSQSTAGELKALKSWIRDNDPVVVATDSGAAIAKSARLKPAIVVGDMDMVAEDILRSGAQLIVCQGHDGTAPGKDRLNRMGVDYDVIVMSGSAEDAATVVLTHARPKVIVTAGLHHDLDHLLDRGRGGMAPAFFTRLAAHDLLFSATAAAAAHRPRLRIGGLLLLFLAMFLALGAALWSTPWGHDLFQWLGHAITSSPAPLDSPPSIATT